MVSVMVSVCQYAFVAYVCVRVCARTVGTAQQALLMEALMEGLMEALMEALAEAVEAARARAPVVARARRARALRRAQTVQTGTGPRHRRVAGCVSASSAAIRTTCARAVA